VTYCNPPYGRQIGAWIKKAYDESKKGKTVVMLLPCRTDTRWWHEYVMKAKEIRFIKGRLKFGGAKTNAPFPSCVVVFKPKGDTPPLNTGKGI
jgi:site-specific DNA-methyltransferase (adenine-specific)